MSLSPGNYLLGLSIRTTTHVTILFIIWVLSVVLFIKFPRSKPIAKIKDVKKEDKNPTINMGNGDNELPKFESICRSILILYSSPILSS